MNDIRRFNTLSGFGLKPVNKTPYIGLDYSPSGTFLQGRTAPNPGLPGYPGILAGTSSRPDFISDIYVANPTVGMGSVSYVPAPEDTAITAQYLNWPGYTTTTPTAQIPGTSLNLPDIGEALRARAMEKPGMFDGLGKTWDNLSGFEKIGSVLGTANALFNGYNAYKQNKIAKDTLNFQKDQYAKQYEAQRKMTNSQLEDRQRSRVWTNPNQTSVHDYMQKYGV